MNIGEVAKKAGVGKATVSRVLNNKSCVKPETAKKVMDACVELNYVPNYFASNLMNRQTNIIGLFFETGNSRYYTYYNDLLCGCIMEAYEHNMQILPYFAPNMDYININLSPGKSPLGGAILLTPNINEKRLLKLNSIKIPLVVIGTLDNGGQYLRVDIKNDELMYNLLGELVASGHKNIGFVNSGLDLTITKDRDRAVEQFVHNHSEVRVLTKYSKDAENEALRPVEELLSEQGGITAFVFSSDVLAYDAYKHFAAKGLQVGKDISVVALGGTEYVDKMNPPLTRGFQNYVKIGRECVKMIKKQQEGMQELEHLLLDSEIIHGSSIAKLNG